MDTSWVKLYRKAKENPVLRDGTAWLVFTWVLLSVNKETGEWNVGRKILSSLTGLPDATIYKTLKRLEKKHHLVTLSSNNRFTTIRIVKWASYQQEKFAGNSSGNNKGTSGEHLGNTYTRIENREIRKEGFSKNPITQDRDFQKLIKVYHPQSDGEMRAKMYLEGLLGSRYPDFKFSSEWKEAKNVLRSSSN